MARRKLLTRLRLDWPLLGKELLEQAAQKRMYVIRVAYALSLFGAFCFYYVRNLSQGSILALGGGLRPFNFIVNAQIVTIFLFLPPMMASALAQEKERDTLGLLFLTDLRPWELILQKYVGRLIPMMTLLFLSLPLLAVTYSLGGVSFDMLFYSAATLFFTCLAVGALALNCSAHEATTFQALLRCWGFCLVFAMCCSFGFLQFIPMRRFGTPPMLFAFVFRSASLSVIYLTFTFVLLLQATRNLQTRAFVARRNPFGHQFKQLDQYWKDIRKLTRAILQKRDHEAFAAAGEVVRRQLKSGDHRQWSLTGFLFTKMQVPTLLSVAIILGSTVFIFLFISALVDSGSMPFTIFIGCFWILALLTVPILSANAVASERMNERLNAILTTPLTGPEILNEWLAPVQRWIQFLVRPLVILIVVEALLKFKSHDPEARLWPNLLVYLDISLLTAWIYPGLVQWVCLWIGLRVQNQIRAMMSSFLLVAAWCIVPLPVSNYLVETGLLSPAWSEWVGFISPVTIIRTVEAIGRPKSEMVLTLHFVILAITHLGLAAGLSWKIRQLCFAKADRYLGRV